MIGQTVLSRFSVLLSLYEKEKVKNFREAMESILHQTLKPDEIVLVIDGPLTTELEQEVQEVQKKYPVIKTVVLPVNQGLGMALNEGLKHCTYELVARMDTDDIAKPERFDKQVGFLEQHPQVDVVGAWVDEFEDDVDHVQSVRKLPEFHEELKVFARQRNPLNHPTVVFRKRAVQEAGGYRHYWLFEDYYLWTRMLMNGATFHNIQESLLFFRTPLDVYKRRGGWKYAVTEVRFRCMLRKKGFLSFSECMGGMPLRFLVRISPAVFRKFLYKRVLR